jgi:hypothetical protein
LLVYVLEDLLTQTEESWDGTSWTGVNNMNSGRQTVGGFGLQTAATGAGGKDPGTGTTSRILEWYNLVNRYTKFSNRKKSSRWSFWFTLLLLGRLLEEELVLFITLPKNLQVLL